MKNNMYWLMYFKGCDYNTRYLWTVNNDKYYDYYRIIYGLHILIKKSSAH